jgi:hypothetical protein
MKRIILLLLLCMTATVFAQTTKIAKLKPTVERLSIHHYNISAVVDDREDTANIGTMRAGLANKKAFVNLPKGARAAITTFLDENLWQSPVMDSIELHILELRVWESAQTFSEQVNLSTKFGFFRNGKKLIDYSGSSYLKNGTDVSPYIGKLVSQSIEQVLKEFDNWWADNRQMFDESKRNEFKVNISLKSTTNDEDQIVYNTARPLTLADFQGTPDALTKALAATYSGFALQYELQGDHTGSVANIEVTPYFERSKSWMKPNGKTAYVLQHEQLHFDIAAMKTYEFIIALKNFPFTVEGFKEQVASLQKQYSKEMEQMQAEYDAETSHGIFKNKQNMWQSRIKSELLEKARTAGL